MNLTPENQGYLGLLEKISEIYQQGRTNASNSVNRILLETYWEMGHYIVEFEQKGALKAEYGSALLENLSRDLKARHGRGFSRSNLNYMRLVYRRYPNCEEAPHKLSWTHICELVKCIWDISRKRRGRKVITLRSELFWPERKMIYL